MRILSVARRKQFCGVSAYARDLECALRLTGHEVEAVTYRDAAHLTLTSFDRILIQHEIVTSITELDAVPLRSIIANWKRAEGISVVEHTVLDLRHFIHRKAFFGAPYLALQWAAFKWIGKHADMIVLTRQAARILAKRGIRARYVPHGIVSRPDNELIGSPLPEDERFTFGIIGHHYSHKRNHLAVDAFAMLPPYMKARSRLAVIGGDPAVDPSGWLALEKSLSKLAAREYIVTGPLSDSAFRAALKGLDLAMLPYEDKAVASGVVSNIVGAGIPALVAPGGTFEELMELGGATIARCWPTDATSKLVEILEDPAPLTTMRLGVQKMRDEHSMQSVALLMLSQRRATTHALT